MAGAYIPLAKVVINVVTDNIAVIIALLMLDSFFVIPLPVLTLSS